MSSRLEAIPRIALWACLAVAPAQLAAAAPPAKGPDRPSRPAEQGCVWEKFSDRALRLEAWVQRCTFGDRKIDFLKEGASLAVRYSDGGGSADPVVEVIDLRPGEQPEHGLKRIFAARTDPKVAARCVLAPYVEDHKAPKGVKRYVFVPNAVYAKELKAAEVPGDLPEPPCGEWGQNADSVEYFEVQPLSGVQKVLFVRVGQDTPLFDEATLRLR